jgi:sigma-B regulation protein RsbU (phosphoserine phosphatase)
LAQTANIPHEALPAKGRRILVVDDSRLQRKITSTMLRRWGFEVLEAASGKDALEIAQDYMPDLIISDWMMPGMTGLELCQEIRQKSKDRYCYFILVTSKSEKAEVARGLDIGADDFLSKPVNASELQARIAAGERIITMQEELQTKNRLISDTLSELQRLYTAVDNDLVEAKKLQQSLVRDRHRSFGSCEISLLLNSAGHVGGDLVGMYQAGPDHVGFYGIDVSGHGISSALMTARLAGYLSSSEPEHNLALRVDHMGLSRPRDPAKVISDLNRLVLEEMTTDLYFTMLLAHLDLGTGALEVAQAGHPHPVILRADGRFETIGEGGLPVGLIPKAEFDTTTHALRSGDRILILSDGVTECPMPDGRMIEDMGLDVFASGFSTETGPALLDGLMWHLTQTAQTDRLPDDVSAVLVEFYGSHLI